VQRLLYLNRGFPGEGFYDLSTDRQIRWMRSQVKEADRVLLVFAETYQRRFEGDEEEGKRPVRAASDKPRGDALQFCHAKSEHMLIKLWLSLIEPWELKA
jgi:hypothetical protein